MLRKVVSKSDVLALLKDVTNFYEKTIKLYGEMTLSDWPLS
jgi:hypothetical protein